MSRFWKLFLFVFAVAACSKGESSNDNLWIVTLDGKTIPYKVEFAQTPDELRSGLMSRQNLPAETGMLFDLSKVRVQTAMWMKDTLIPLDMLFADKDGTIYWIYENAEPQSTKLIVAPYPATGVLEVNGGDVAKYGIKIGDNIRHPMFKEKTEPTAVSPAAEVAKVKGDIKDELQKEEAPKPVILD